MTALALMTVLLLSACATGRLYIPYDLSPEELVQRAQEASDRNRFGQAKQFYEALLERNSHNLVWVVTAEYEIAFINYRQRNLAEAREGLNTLLERYEAPGGAALPEKFRVLAHVVLARIDERESRPVRWWNRNR